VNVLYLSNEGLLEPLGQSQVLAYVKQLSAMGLRHHLVTLERERDLQDHLRVEELRRSLDAAGIAWTWSPYLQGSRRAVAANCRRLFTAAARQIAGGEVDLIHARGFVPATVAWSLRTAFGAPFVFDTRGDWLTERVLEGQFTRPRLLAAARLLERRLLRDAAAIVTLTDLYARDLRQGVLYDCSKLIETIPTCADYTRFSLEGCSRSSLPLDAVERLSGRLVIGLVGSVNRSYQIDESIRFFKHVLARNPAAHLLCLTRQDEELSRRVRAAGVPEQAFTVTAAHHEQMSEWMSLIDWGLLLLTSSSAKRGSMPTKLAEFFAAGVQPVQFGCNSEVAHWVSAAGSGLVLESLDEDAMRLGAEIVAFRSRSAVSAHHARERTRSHFDLTAGATRYANILRTAADQFPPDRGRRSSVLRWMTRAARVE
jgi:glycosyltransferase involved in cell wall biosynthesis